MAPPSMNHWEEDDTKYNHLLNYIIKRTENVESPMNIYQLVKDFNKKCGAVQTIECLRYRVFKIRTVIHKIGHIDTKTKVKVLFALSGPVDADFLKDLQKDALVKVDENKRITHYKAHDESLELKGGHSHSAKTKNALFESKRSLRSLIIDYLENKDNTDAVPKNKKEKEMWQLIEFINEKCQTVDSPLKIHELTKDFNNRFGMSIPLTSFRERIRRYCREFQKTEFMDTHFKVRQLFGLSAKLDSDFLEKLRKDAVVEVDDMNRITKYTANDGRFTLHGDHSHSAKVKLGWIERRKKRNAVEKHSISDEIEEIEKEDGYSADDSDEYSSEEFGNELNSDDENEHLDETEDFMGLFNETNNFDNETPVRNRSEMSIYDSFDFDPTIERSHRSEETEKREDDGGKKNDNKNPKRKNSTPTAPASEKKRNKGTTGSSSSKQIGWFPNSSMWPNELDDYDTNYLIDGEVKLKPFRGSLQEDLNEFEGYEDFQQILKPPQALDEQDQIGEVLIKIEVEEPVELKPEASHNCKIKFFEAIQSLILFLNTPSLYWIQTKIQQKIQTIRGPNEVMLNNEIALTIELLIAQLTDHSVVNSSKNVESVNLSSFLCYLKAAILNSKLSGVDVLVRNINELIEESHVKRISMEKVANALLVTLGIDGF